MGCVATLTTPAWPKIHKIFRKSAFRSYVCDAENEKVSYCTAPWDTLDTYLPNTYLVYLPTKNLVALLAGSSYKLKH